MTDCEGCSRKTNSTCFLIMPPSNRNKIIKKPRNCPCMTCIIKMVCKDQCDERYVFWGGEYNRIYEGVRRRD